MRHEQSFLIINHFGRKGWWEFLSLFTEPTTSLSHIGQVNHLACPTCGGHLVIWLRWADKWDLCANYVRNWHLSAASEFKVYVWEKSGQQIRCNWSMGGVCLFVSYCEQYCDIITRWKPKTESFPGCIVLLSGFYLNWREVRGRMMTVVSQRRRRRRRQIWRPMGWLFDWNDTTGCCFGSILSLPEG